MTTSLLDFKAERHHLKLKQKLIDHIDWELCSRQEHADRCAKRYTNFPTSTSNLALAAPINEMNPGFLVPQALDRNVRKKDLLLAILNEKKPVSFHEVIYVRRYEALKRLGITSSLFQEIALESLPISEFVKG
uniref:Uncharacterized protein n=1 Tax=Romanomermis culicivorax TaxID=13658 RepID=A0A915ISL3_ROMCU